MHLAWRLPVHSCYSKMLSTATCRKPSTLDNSARAMPHRRQHLDLFDAITVCWACVDMKHFISHYCGLGQPGNECSQQLPLRSARCSIHRRTCLERHRTSRPRPETLADQECLIRRSHPWCFPKWGRSATRRTNCGPRRDQYTLSPCMQAAR